MPNLKPQISQVPDQESFAIHLAECFLEENNIEIDYEGDETALDVVLSIQDVNVQFSRWLCSVLHSNSFPDVQPEGLLN